MNEPLVNVVLMAKKRAKVSSWALWPSAIAATAATTMHKVTLTMDFIPRTFFGTSEQIGRGDWSWPCNFSGFLYSVHVDDGRKVIDSRQLTADLYTLKLSTEILLRNFDRIATVVSAAAVAGLLFQRPATLYIHTWIFLLLFI